MSTLLQARSVSHSAGNRHLFDELDLSLSAGDRLGLVGHNGCGKSTLLRALAGALETDSGTISRARGLALASVEQFLPEALAQGSVHDAVAACTGEAEHWMAAVLLEQLGFQAAQRSLRVAQLSGGQLNRLMLARALAVQPQLLLLDEPTNHLDLATLVLFERTLREFDGAFVLVSHDREFLDAVTHSTAILRDGRLYRFNTSYSHARQQLVAMDEAARHRREAEERKIGALKESAKRLATWGQVYDNEKFVRRAQSMEKRIGRLEDERTFVSSGSPLDLKLTLGDSRSKRAITVEQARIVAGQRELFRIDELIIRPGERVALLGHNGVGKSTFIKRIMLACAASDEDDNLDPQIRLSPRTVVGYYDQELNQVSSSQSLLAFVQARTELDAQRAHQVLASAGFEFRDHDRSVRDSSGGERARLLFLVLGLLQPNLLVMDEPTNHVDIDGKEQLEHQLVSSAATLLVTSHDRRFLTTVTQRYLWIRDGQLKEIYDPDEFFNSARDDERSASPAPLPKRSAAPPVSSEADQLLERLVELEARLQADLERKPKFQKPQRQASWRAEIAALYLQLDGTGS